MLSMNLLHLGSVGVNAFNYHAMDLLLETSINWRVLLFQIANHPLLVRRIYSDKDVVRIAKILYPKGVFGFECTLERAIQEMNGYNDFSMHRVFLFSMPGTFYLSCFQVHDQIQLLSYLFV